VAAPILSLRELLARPPSRRPYRSLGAEMWLRYGNKASFVIHDNSLITSGK
jgi:hypothetical protein